MLAARTSCARKHPSASRVPWSTENDKNVHGDEHGGGTLRRSLAVLSSLEELTRFFDSHDGARPGPGRRGSSRLWDLVAVAELVAPEYAA